MGKKKVVLDGSSPFAGLNAVLESKKLAPVKLSSDDSLVGIAVPSLAFQYLLGTTALPLSRSYQIVGREGSFKSTFMYEIMRWYIDSGGYVFLAETEAKDSGYIRNGVMQWDPERIDRVAVQSTIAYQQWMSSVTHTYDYFKERMESSGVYHPLLVCVDSITAAAAEESIEKAGKEGCASPGFPVLAKHLSEDFKHMPSHISGFPSAFLFINHLKPGTATGPYSVDTIPGGRALSFYNCLTLQLAKKSEKEYSSGNVSSIITFKTRKNSNGKDGRKVDIELIRWSQDNPNMTDHVDYVAFNWASSDISFLLSYMDNPVVGAELRRKVKDLVGLHTAKIGTSQGVYSEALGIPKDSPVSYTEAGMKLHADKDLFAKLQNVLRIRKLACYSADVDYLKLLKDTADESRLRIQRLAHDVAAPVEASDDESNDNYYEEESDGEE